MRELTPCSHFIKSWRIRLHALPALVVFFYRNLLSISQDGVSQVMDVLLDCLGDENVEVREMASKVLAGVVRCSQRQSIVQLKVGLDFSLTNAALNPDRWYPRTDSQHWFAKLFCLLGVTLHMPKQYDLSIQGFSGCVLSLRASRTPWNPGCHRSLRVRFHILRVDWISDFRSIDLAFSPPQY